MTIAIKTILEVENGGSDNNGAGFNPTNANFPTDGAISSANTTAPVITSASYTFVAGDVGALIFIKSGTNTIPGFYKVTSVATGAATLDAAIGHGVLINTNNLTTYRLSTSAGCGTAASLTTVTWGIAYIQQTSAAVAYTDMVIGATTTQLTSSIHPFTINLTGNLLKVTGGTGFTTGWYEVVSVSANVATMDRSVGTTASSGGTGNLGGALATVNTAITNINNGTTTATTTQAAGGLTTFIKYSVTPYTTATQINIAGGQGGTRTRIIGYNARWHDLDSANDGVNYPIIQASAVISTSILGLQSGTPQGDETLIRNLVLDCNSNAGGLFIGIGYSDSINLIIKNWPSAKYGLRTSDLSRARRIFCTGGQNGGIGGIWFNAANVFHMVASVNNVGQPGFYNQGGAGAPTLSHCFSLNNTTVASNFGDGVYSAGNPGFILENCSIAGNARDGIHFDGTAFNSGPNGAASGTRCLNNIFSKNSGSAINSNGSVYWNFSDLDYNARFSNTSADINVPPGLNDISLLGDPFVSSAATLNSLQDVITNFALNNTANAGASCRGTGIPSYTDIGALQHQDTGGGGGTNALPPFIIAKPFEYYDS